MTGITTAPSTATRWAAYGLSSLAIAFLTFDTVIKVLQTGMAVEATTALGYPAPAVLTIGLIELTCLVLYVLPPTAVLGAVLLTGYLGGAVATHVRLGNPLFSHQLFPLYVAAFLWGGLYLREPRLRALLPFRR
ncbi:MAG: DoxX family protein [Acidobacteriota bacterium]